MRAKPQPVAEKIDERSVSLEQRKKTAPGDYLVHAALADTCNKPRVASNYGQITFFLEPNPAVCRPFLGK
jgi:hypothetical protein